MKGVALRLAMNTSKEVNSSFSLSYFFSIRYQTLISDIDRFRLALFIVLLLGLTKGRAQG